MMKISLLLLSTLVSLASPFSEYWYKGKAEVAVYDLEQSRYGSLRSGTATLIFVTEPFSQTKHVKLDNPQQEGQEKATVLKLNTVKKYTTGLYPYSIMTSAFIDVESGLLYKANTSIQEWCGQTFLQANATHKGNYALQGFSYFESEGDQQFSLSNTLLAEEIPLKLRLGHLTQETTALMVCPPQEFLRTLHQPIQSTKAQLSWEVNDTLTTLTISYNNALQLVTTYTFDTAFPHTIRKWTERYTKGGQSNTSSATLKSINLLPYWNMNSSKFDSMRKEIGLE